MKPCKSHKAKNNYSELRYLIRESKYQHAFLNGDPGIIDLLDYWLEQWLELKDSCPVCGTEDPCP